METRLFASLILSGSAWLALAGPNLYRIETVAGSADMGDGGPAIAAEIGNIQGIAVDPAGNLYLSDTDHHRVRKVDTRGIITTVAGSGVPGFAGDGGPAASAQLNLPYGLAAGPAGDLYIADLGNNRVRRITPDGLISTIAGTGSRQPAGDGGPASNAALSAPRNLTLDSFGNLYISEFERHRVRKVTPDGRITTIAGTGARGFSGDGGFAVLAQLAFPAGLAVDASGSLYIADSQNQRIRRITSRGMISTVLGGVPATALLTPTAVAVNREGAVFVLDQSHTILSLTPSAAWITAAGTGAAAFSGDGTSASQAALLCPNDLALGSSGDLYIADGSRIRRVDSSGIIHTVAGDAYVHAVGDGGPALAARLLQPASVALDTLGNLYIAETGAHRVRKVTASGAIETSFGNGVPGFIGDGAPSAGSPSSGPAGVAVDSTGALIVAEAGNHRVRRIAAGRVSTLIGTGDAGTTAEAKRGPETRLRAPRGLCVDSLDAVFVVDTGNHRVLRLGPDSLVTLAAGAGDAGDGGDDGPARAARLNQPLACAIDANGNLLIADTLNHRIRQVAPQGTISTIAGTGVPGVSGDEGPAALARLSAPAGIAVDPGGSVFISDTGNHRIRQITPDGIIHSIAGGNWSGFTGDDGLASSALLHSPGGLQLDRSGSLYFADTGNNRVRRLVPIASAAASLTELSVLNAASLLEGPIAPGEILTIFAAGLGPEEGSVGSFDSMGRLATNVDGTEVWFNDVPAPIFYAQSAQLNVQAPYAVAGAATVKMEIFRKGRSLAAVVLAVKEAAPALFPVAANPDGSPNSSESPAPRGGIVTLYATGEGLTDGSNLAGQIAEPPYARPRLPVALLVGGVGAELLFAGAAPGMVGVLQINARLPGDYLPRGRTPVMLTVGSVSSPVFWLWLD